MYSQEFVNRFNAKWRIDKATGCWVWTGAVKGKGYGNIKLERSRLQEYAHRIAYRLHIGGIPKGKYVLHRCDNPRCVNPSHLFLGDALDNAVDMRSKGRHLYGERNTESVLIEEDVRKIRQLCSGGMQQWRVAAMYHISQMTVSRIVRRERWKHVK